MATQLLPLKSGRTYDIMFMHDDEKIMKSLGYLRAIQKNNKVAHLFFKPDSEMVPMSFDHSKRKASIGEIQVEGDWYLGKYGELSQYSSQEPDIYDSNEGNASDPEMSQQGGKKSRKSRNQKKRKSRKQRNQKKQKNTRRH